MNQVVMNELVKMSQEIIKLKDENRELLKALKRCQQELRKLSFKDTDIVLALESAYTAIAKAEATK